MNTKSLALSDSLVREILLTVLPGTPGRSRRNSDTKVVLYSVNATAKRLGCAPTTIIRILAGTAYKHVPRPPLDKPTQEVRNYLQAEYREFYPGETPQTNPGSMYSLALKYGLHLALVREAINGTPVPPNTLPVPPTIKATQRHWVSGDTPDAQQSSKRPKRAAAITIAQIDALHAVYAKWTEKNRDVGDPQLRSVFFYKLGKRLNLPTTLVRGVCLQTTYKHYAPGGTRLTMEQAAEIRRDYRPTTKGHSEASNPVGMHNLALRYGVPMAHIADVIRRKQLMPAEV